MKASEECVKPLRDSTSNLLVEETNIANELRCFSFLRVGKKRGNDRIDDRNTLLTD